MKFTRRTSRPNMWLYVVFAASMALPVLACLSDATGSSSARCGLKGSLLPNEVPVCLYARHVISASDRDNASRVFIQAQRLQSLYRSDTGIANFDKASELTRALAHIQEYYDRGLFADSARFHRMLDQVVVTLTRVQDISLTPDAIGRYWPRTTPYLSWINYPGLGIYFQPVTTAEYVVDYATPRPSIPTDSLLAIADRLYAYALWRDVGGVRFPVWEYQFTWTSGGLTDFAPWVSGMSQGEILEVFGFAYQRTSDAVWLSRGHQVLNSFKVTWGEGGVLLPDTAHGYWWEEFHPAVRVWNGSVQALVGVGYFGQVTGDSSAKRMFSRGLDGLKYYTPLYDTGYWTLYSLTQGYNSVAYHNYEIHLLDTLYALSGDMWCKETADRWRTYSPPPGVP